MDERISAEARAHVLATSSYFLASGLSFYASPPSRSFRLSKGSTEFAAYLSGRGGDGLTRRWTSKARRAKPD